MDRKRPTSNPRRATYGKSLPKDEAASVFAWKAVTARGDALVLGWISELISFAARIGTIVKLTGAPTMAIRRLVEREGGDDKKRGRLPTTLARIFCNIAGHLEAGLFARYFSVYWVQENYVVNAPAFLRAYKHYLSHLDAEPLIDCEAALMICEQLRDGEAILSNCPTCRLTYLRSKAALKIRSTVSHGECPYCRDIVTGSTKQRVRVTVSKRQHDLVLEMLESA